MLHHSRAAAPAWQPWCLRRAPPAARLFPCGRAPARSASSTGVPGLDARGHPFRFRKAELNPVLASPYMDRVAWLLTERTVKSVSSKSHDSGRAEGRQPRAVGQSCHRRKTGADCAQVPGSGWR